MRTLIFGAQGQLGRDLMQVFRGAGEVQGYDLPEVNVADETTLQPVAEKFGPDLMINAAAYTAVDDAEDHLEEAFLANEAGARNVAELASYYNVPVLYFSTDYVFNGNSDRPYRPDDPIDPIAVYGRTKAAGEAATRKNPLHFILRTAWLYGPGGNNFIEKILAAASRHPTLKVVEDEVGSPTHTWDLAQAALALAKTKAYGTYHAVNTGACSRYELATTALKWAGLNTPVKPCASSEYPSKAPRPKYSVLDTSTLVEATNTPLRSWQEALKHYMERRG